MDCCQAISAILFSSIIRLSNVWIQIIILQIQAKSIKIFKFFLIIMIYLLKIFTPTIKNFQTITKKY